MRVVFVNFVRWSAESRGKVRVAARRWGGLFGGASKRGDAIPSVQHPERPRKAVIRTVTSDPACGKPSYPTWSESFIFAGGSAFLLLIAILFPDYWFISFFALTPFLYRIIKATPGESLRLGFLFGLSFFSLSMLDSLISSPLPSVLKLFSGTALFALFGWTSGWASRRWRDCGFNPFILVFFWVGLEMGLVKLGFIGGLLGKTEFSQPFLHGLVVLFGFLTVSAIIVLLNLLLVLAIVKTLWGTKTSARTVREDERTLQLLYTHGLFGQRVYLVPESRAPPYGGDLCVAQLSLDGQPPVLVKSVETVSPI